MALLTRFPILVWAGAGLLGWIAGELMIEDPVSKGYLDSLGMQYLGVGHKVHRIAMQIACTACSCWSGWLLMKWHGRKEAAEHARARPAEINRAGIRGRLRPQ